MESVIARLLKDFEDGKMSRRQLIQSLAMAAAAAPAAALAETPQAPFGVPAGKGKAPWKTVYLDHISYAVSDYKRSVAFYKDLMGWEVVDDTGTQATLNINDIGQIIIRNNRQASNAQSAQAQGRPPITGVINHVSWGVQPWDTDKVKAELEQRGLKPRVDNVGQTFKSFHVTDPDGWDLQISNQAKEKHDLKG